jgi:uncharacterized protein (DUF433 family)
MRYNGYKAFLRSTHMNLPDFLAQDRYGFVHLTGHRVGLRHVVELYNDGYSAEKLHDYFPTIPLALIHKLIAFYLENRTEADAYIRQSREALDRHANGPQQGPDAGELRRRMDALRSKESA